MGLLKLLSWLAAPTLRSRFNLSFYAYSTEGGFTGRHQLEQGGYPHNPLPRLRVGRRAPA